MELSVKDWDWRGFWKVGLLVLKLGKLQVNWYKLVIQSMLQSRANLALLLNFWELYSYYKVFTLWWEHELSPALCLECWVYCFLIVLSLALSTFLSCMLRSVLSQRLTDLPGGLFLGNCIFPLLCTANSSHLSIPES